MKLEDLKLAAEKAGMTKHFLHGESRDDMYIVGKDFLQRLHAALPQDTEAADWMKACRGLDEVIVSIGTILGAKMPEQLVSDVARQRMEELTALKAAPVASAPAVQESPYTFPIGEDGEYQILNRDSLPVGTILYYHDAKVIAEALAQRAASQPDSERDAALEKRIELAKSAAAAKEFREFTAMFPAQRRHIANLLAHKWQITAIELQSKYAVEDFAKGAPMRDPNRIETTQEQAKIAVENIERKRIAAMAAQQGGVRAGTCANACQLPPEGWYCTRAPGHEGPCAAHQK